MSWRRGSSSSASRLSPLAFRLSPLRDAEVLELPASSVPVCLCRLPAVTLAVTSSLRCAWSDVHLRLMSFARARAISIAAVAPARVAHSRLQAGIALIPSSPAHRPVYRHRCPREPRDARRVSSSQVGMQLTAGLARALHRYPGCVDFERFPDRHLALSSGAHRCPIFPWSIDARGVGGSGSEQAKPRETQPKGPTE